MTSPNFLVRPQIYASKEKRFANMIIDIAGFYLFLILIGVFFGAMSLLGIDGPINYLSTLTKI